MKYPDGEIVTTHYNNNMLPTDVSGAGNYVLSMTYDSASRLLTRALGNGLTQTYAYYPWNQQGGRLQTLVTGTLQNLSHQYDAVGNITQIANSVAGETSVYGYDTLDRLTSWQLNQNPVESYSYDSAGNLDVKNGLDLNYNDAAHKHAVTHIGTAQKYWYDQNGNQVTRVVGTDTYTQIYDAENRMVEVKKNSVTIAQFTFDGDGKRVKSVINGETILFVGAHFEMKGSQATKYYFAGATRIAMRKYTIPQSMEVEYMLGDHLGSTSLTTDANGVKISELRYKPWGETRYTWTDAPATTPTYELTKYQYTGQYSYDVEFGLKFYNARWLDSATGRFAQADTVIPQSQGVQAYDRYGYVNNNPVKYVDPSGHGAEIFLLVAVIVGAIILNYDISRRHGANEPPCSGTLSSCFQQNKLMKFSDNQDIDENEFKDMLDTIDNDLDSKFRTSLDPARSVYDTPFFNGDVRFDSTDIVTDSVVCIEDKCSKQSAVNYVAQGMYSAKTSQSLDDAIGLANSWNEWWWGSQLTDDESYWLEYGYNYYCQNNSGACQESEKLDAQ